MKKFPRFLARSAAAVVACAVLVYTVEFLIGRYLVEEPGHFPLEMFRPDEIRGTALAPGFDREVRRVRRFRVTVNEQGYRDTDWSEKPQPRVLLAGSSATFGVGLDQSYGIAAMLEKMLGGRASVLNAAVYSYGPPQILTTIAQECHRWSPQLILYLHEYKLTRRDFMKQHRANPGAGESDVSMKPVFSWTLRATRAFLSNRGLHPGQIAERLWGLDRLGKRYLQERYAVTRPSAEFCGDCATRAAGTIRSMRHRANECKADFIMAVLPGPAEAYYGLREPATRAVLSKLEKIAPDLSIVDLRIDVPRGSRMNIPGLDYFDSGATAWIARQLVKPVKAILFRERAPR